MVEEGDRTLPMWHKQVGEIIVSWRKQRNKQESSSPDQLVIMAKRWNSAVEQFTKTFIVEAVIYGKVEMVPVFLTDFSDKIEHLKTLVMERDRTKKIVICCKDMKTPNMVGLMVSELGEKATALHLRSGHVKSPGQYSAHGLMLQSPPW